MSYLAYNGKQIHFQGEAGREYTLFRLGHMSVVARYAKVDGLTLSFADKMTFRSKDHTVEVSHEKVLVDGKAPLESHSISGGWCWIDRNRVTVGQDGFLFGMILDDGKGNEHKKHDERETLEKVPHVSLDVRSPIPANSRGVLVEPTNEPKTFEA